MWYLRLESRLLIIQLCQSQKEIIWTVEYKIFIKTSKTSKKCNVGVLPCECLYAYLECEPIWIKVSVKHIHIIVIHAFWWTKMKRKGTREHQFKLQERTTIKLVCGWKKQPYILGWGLKYSEESFRINIQMEPLLYHISALFFQCCRGTIIQIFKWNTNYILTSYSTSSCLHVLSAYERNIECTWRKVYCMY